MLDHIMMAADQRHALRRQIHVWRSVESARSANSLLDAAIAMSASNVERSRPLQRPAAWGSDCDCEPTGGPPIATSRVPSADCVYTSSANVRTWKKSVTDISVVVT